LTVAAAAFDPVANVFGFFVDRSCDQVNGQVSAQIEPTVPDKKFRRVEWPTNGFMADELTCSGRLGIERRIDLFFR
jgi:hypothetical protein